ncbi:putative LppA-like lipoprotein [Sediminihabitans luteus]|uniref:Putative LppA-like lipoprotein n=1 Tax=Sediminihabitans luteus TaxID=1138585 RepID=A0A2M9CDJ1_9CELL|nr:LppA family lipoprotein [Sediminihabitans luteus]PJJ69935.1 putative LppA-like lipoprotein [Sediminihabitans luteus]GII99255.1 hypothetical protein Slu03_16330 [Sediminihabitans luteus]
MVALSLASAATFGGCAASSDSADPSTVEDYLGTSTEGYDRIDQRAPLETVQAENDAMILAMRDALTAQFPELEWVEAKEGQLSGMPPADDIFTDDGIEGRSYNTTLWATETQLSSYPDTDIDTAIRIVSDIGNDYGYGDLSTIQRLSDPAVFGTVADNADGDKYYFTSDSGTTLRARSAGHLTSDQLDQVAALVSPTPTP